MSSNVVISGGTSGIGKMLVKLFLANNMNVLTFSRKQSNINSLKRECSEFSKNLYCYQCDIGNIKSIDLISKEILKKFKKIDFLINNSGTNTIGPIEKINIKDWKNIMDVNLTGPFYLTQKVLPLLKKGSLILNMGSLASRQGFPGWSSYCSSKFGLKGFTESLREELRPKKIRVVHAEIGATDTAIWDNLDGDWNKESMMKDSEVAEVIFRNITIKGSVNVDELFLMPPAGIL